MSVYTYLKRAFKRKDVVRCLRCNRILTNEKSINRGYGRKCYRIINLGENIPKKHISPNNEELLDRIRKLELDNNFIKHQLKHRTVINKSKDSDLNWDIPKEVKEIRNEYKITFNIVVKELKVIFTEDFDYHNVLSPINVREKPEDPPIIIENLELIH